MDRAIQEEFSGDLKNGLLAIIGIIYNKQAFYAERLKMSMDKPGTDEAQLTRIIVTRSEIDLMDIKSAFERIVGESLKVWIEVSEKSYCGNENETFKIDYSSNFRTTPLVNTETHCMQ